MLILNQEIIVILLLITCGVVVGIMKSIVDFLMLICSRLAWRIIIDTIFIIGSGTLFVYVMYITTDFTFKFIDALLIMLGFWMYSAGPLRLLKQAKCAILNKINKFKTTQIFRFIFR